MISLTQSKSDDDPKGIKLTAETFKTEGAFNISAYIILLILALLYTVFW